MNNFLKEHVIIGSVPDSPKKYILRANSNEGIIYYMNVIMVTGQKEHAKVYDDLDEAKKDLEHFKLMFTHSDSLSDFEIVEQ